MPRVLRRPMFRLGGNTDQGIMSGVAPRQGYANGDLIRGAQERKKVLSEMIGRPSDRSASDFWVDWGLGMVSGTPRGNIFATAAEQAKEPLQRFRETKAAEKGFQRQLGMVAAEAEMSHQDKMALMTEEQKNEMAQIALKNMNKDERIMMEKRAAVLAEHLNIPFEEALRMEVFRKTEDPKNTRRRLIEERRSDYTSGTFPDSYPIADAKATFDIDRANIVSRNPDLEFDPIDPFIDVEGKRKEYTPGSIYFNPADGRYYRYDGVDADPKFVDISDTIQ